MTSRGAVAAPEVPYQFRWGFVARWLLSQLSGRSRSVAHDAERELAAIIPVPRIEGGERIPPSGPVILVMNHYERPGLRVWWPALLVSREVWRRRHQDPPVRWMITDRFYRYHLGFVPVPSALVSWVLRRVARAYGLIVVPRRLEQRGARTRALLAARAQLRACNPQVVGLTPDAESGGGRRPGRAWRNAGAAAAVLSGGSIPVLPVAVFEDVDGALVARFGEPAPFLAPQEGRGEREALARQLMERIAVLLARGVASAGPSV